MQRCSGLSARSLAELTSWAHEAIGHGTSSAAQAIVELDDDPFVTNKKTAALAQSVIEQFLDATYGSSARWRTAH